MSEDSFSQRYRVFPITLLHRQEYNYGGKVLLPPSALARLLSTMSEDASHSDSNPWLFSLVGDRGTVTHCGVLEFIADEGRIYAPEWMMKRIGTRGGDWVTLSQVSLPKGAFVRLQPQSVGFLELQDPRSSLEQALTLFHTLTKGDVIAVELEGKVHEVAVLEISQEGTASGGISVHETDLRVDFAAPVGYVEPAPKPRAAKTVLPANAQVPSALAEPGPFTGSFKRISDRAQPVAAGSSEAPLTQLPKSRLYIPQMQTATDADKK